MVNLKGLSQMRLVLRVDDVIDELIKVRDLARKTQKRIASLLNQLGGYDLDSVVLWKHR